MDHFSLLNLPPKYFLDMTQLESQYLKASRQVHPDHQQGAEAEQMASEQLAARLNEAYTTLTDAFRRANYLLELQGGPSASELKETPQAFLNEMLDLRMEIEELKATKADLGPTENELVQRRDGLLQKAGEKLDAETKTPSDLADIRRLLNATKFVNGLLKDLRND
jgi:molecular chaperone HscB